LPNRWGSWAKVAAEPEHNTRLRDEHELLNKLRHTYVVELVEALELGDRTAFLMHPVYADRQKKTVETLGQRLRKEGRLHVDLLQRFGEDLLDIVNFLVGSTPSTSRNVRNQSR